MGDKRVGISIRLLKSHLDKIDAGLAEYNKLGDRTNPESRTSYLVSAALDRAEQEEEARANA